MRTPKRIKRYEGRRALVDGIPFEMPVYCRDSPALMAVFTIDYDKAVEAIEGNEVHPLRLWKKALLLVTVIDYRDTVIGKYVEYSIAIACTHGPKPAPRLLGALMQRRYGTGQYVIELPVSTEISVKGGKGIWGMPKSQGNLDFKITDDKISSQYDLDEQLVTYVEIDRPKLRGLPIKMAAANYCAFRGMLMKSYIYVGGKAGFEVGKRAKAKFILGDHPRADKLRALNVSETAMATAFIENATGALDDHFECWYLTYDGEPPQIEGMESVIDLTLSEEWPAPPTAVVPGI